MSTRAKLLKMPEWYEKFRIPMELVEEAGVRRVTDREARSVVGIKALPGQKLDGLVFPYLHPIYTAHTEVYCRIRREMPEVRDGKEQNKYIGHRREDRERTLYYPPNALRRAKSKRTTLLLVEAEKSVLAIEAWLRRIKRSDLLPLGMGGKDGWRDRELGVLPDMEVCNGRRVIVLLDANLATNPDVKETRDALVVELRSRACEVQVATLPQLEGVNGPDDLLALPDGDALLAQALAEAQAGLVAPYAEQSLARRFATAQADNLRHVPKLGWLRWNEQHWKHDEKGIMEMDVHSLCETAADECGKPRKAEAIKSRRTIEAVMRLAQPYLRVTIDELDAYPMLLGTLGGTVDLRTGNLRPAQREDYITKLTAVAPEKREPRLWLKFLREITLGDKDLQNYLQVASGYCLTGEISEHALFFLYGTGGNGKSVFVNTLLGVLGDYAMVAAMDVFTATRQSQHTQSIARLRGARFVAATETEVGSRWAEARLKAMTGGEPITAHFMRENDITFLPQFKPVISGNHKPSLLGVDEAMRRRMHLLPFNLNLAEAKRDKKLMEKLRAEWPAILQWAIEGCLRWQKEGLQKPQAVAEATEEYFSEQDVLGNWLETVTLADKNGKEQPSHLYMSYKDWAAAKGEHYILSQIQFSQRLAERGFRTKKQHGDRYVIGLRLIAFRGGMPG